MSRALTIAAICVVLAVIIGTLPGCAGPWSLFPQSQRQAKSELKSDDGAYCCLGVLCTAAGARWVEPELGMRHAELKGKPISKVGDEVLRPSFLKRIGLTKRQQSRLTNMNDGKDDLDDPKKSVPQHTFKQIADYIAKNL